MLQEAGAAGQVSSQPGPGEVEVVVVVVMMMMMMMVVVVVVVVMMMMMMVVVVATTMSCIIEKLLFHGLVRTKMIMSVTVMNPAMTRTFTIWMTSAAGNPIAACR